MIPSASRKLFIVGSVASGKTTLAACLSEQLGIPWYELDSLVHVRTAHGRIKRTPEQQMEAMAEIDRQGSWIFDSRPATTSLIWTCCVRCTVGPAILKRVG